MLLLLLLAGLLVVVVPLVPNRPVGKLKLPALLLLFAAVSAAIVVAPFVFANPML